MAAGRAGGLLIPVGDGSLPAATWPMKALKIIKVVIVIARGVLPKTGLQPCECSGADYHSIKVFAKIPATKREEAGPDHAEAMRARNAWRP